MGTNYSLRRNICTCCGRYDEIHVGKKSWGWSFGFRAYRHELLNVDHPEWGHEPESPLGFPVMSRADWRKVLTETPGELWDEYGEQVQGDPVAWLDEWEPPDAKQIATEEANTHWPPYMTRTGWRDPDGFRFDDREFS